MRGIIFGRVIVSMEFVIFIFIHIYVGMESFCVILVARIFVSVSSGMMMAINIIVVVIDFLVVCLST